MTKRKKRWLFFLLLFFTIFATGITVAVIYSPFVHKYIIRFKYFNHKDDDYEFKNYKTNNLEIEKKLINHLADKVYLNNKNEIVYTYEEKTSINYYIIVDYLQYYRAINNTEILEQIKSRMKALPSFYSIKPDTLGEYLKILFAFDNEIDIKTFNNYLKTFWDDKLNILNLETYEKADVMTKYISSSYSLMEINNAYLLKGYKLSDYFNLVPHVEYIFNNFNFSYPHHLEPDDKKVRNHVVDGFATLAFINTLPIEDAKKIALPKKDQLIKWNENLKKHYFPNVPDQDGLYTSDKILIYSIFKKLFDINDQEHYDFIKKNWRNQILTNGPYWYYYLNLLMEIFGKDFVAYDIDFNKELKNKYLKSLQADVISANTIKNSIQHLTHFYLMFKNEPDLKVDLNKIKNTIDQTYDEVYISYEKNTNFWDLYATELYWYLIFYLNFDPSVINNKKSELLKILSELENRDLSSTDRLYLFKAQSYLLKLNNNTAKIPYFILYNYADQIKEIKKENITIKDSVEILIFSKIVKNIDTTTINLINQKINNLINEDPKIQLNPREIYGIYLYFSENFDKIYSETKVNKERLINWLKSYLEKYQFVNIIGYFYTKQILKILENYDKN